MKHLRLYVSPEGNINIFDPNSSNEVIIKALAPDFKTSIPEPMSRETFFQRIRRKSTPTTRKELKKLTMVRLKSIHDKLLINPDNMPTKNNDVSLLDLKIEIARQELENCQLCGNNCRINRFLDKGKCNLGAQAFYSSAYVHLAEESLINPSLAVNLDSQGCGLDCCFCQARGIAETNTQSLVPLDAILWPKILPDMDKVASIEFAGGSPDENILGILEFLNKAPQKVPRLVSNCHLYANEVVYRLWDGVIDVYVADFKFGNEQCAIELAGIKDYVHIALYGLKSILRQTYKPEVIIRLLLVPTHTKCCALTILKILEPFKEQILLNVMDQYVPEYKILQGFHPELNTRVHQDEFQGVVSQAKELGFRLT